MMILKISKVILINFGMFGNDSKIIATPFSSFSNKKQTNKKNQNKFNSDAFTNLIVMLLELI